MEFTKETFYGNESDTFYTDQFGRVWIVQSVDYTGETQHELFSTNINELANTKTPVIECDGFDIELPDAVFELTETAKEEVIKQAKKDAQLFVDEWNEELDPAETDWDSEAFNSCNFSFHTDDQKTFDETWSLYQATLVEETRNLVV